MRIKKLTTKSKITYYITDHGDIFNEKNGFISHITGGKYHVYLDGKPFPVDKLVNSLFNNEKTKYVAHLNGEKLDNFYENLKGINNRGDLMRFYATYRRLENPNYGIYKTPKMLNRNKPYRVVISKSNKKITLGYFHTFEEAQHARDLAYSKLGGV